MELSVHLQTNKIKEIIRMKKIIVLVALMLVVVGCTENSRARMWGGTATTTLPKGQKLVTVTWKQSELWILTRPMQTNEVAETLTFQEKSSFGMIEGKVIFQEQK